MIAFLVSEKGNVHKQVRVVPMDRNARPAASSTKFRMPGTTDPTISGRTQDNRIGIAIGIAVAIGLTRVQEPSAMAIAIPIRIPMPTIIYQRGVPFHAPGCTPAELAIVRRIIGARPGMESVRLDSEFPGMASKRLA